MHDAQTLHLHPTATLAARVLLPGDPGRALALAQHLMDEPLMFNHHRGLWGYTGRAKLDGELVTIQSTGMGGPSAAIVLQELVMLGATHAVRVGTCGALAPRLGLGELLIANESIAADGASRALGAGPRSHADHTLTQALRRCQPDAQAATIVSTDLFYEPSALAEQAPAARYRRAISQREREWANAGALAVEMESATLFTLGAKLGVDVACVLVVSDTMPAADGVRTRIGAEQLTEAAERMGTLAVAALAGVGQPMSGSSVRA
jgi:uridine phosphorylase